MRSSRVQSRDITFNRHSGIHSPKTSHSFRGHFLCSIASSHVMPNDDMWMILSSRGHQSRPPLSRGPLCPIVSVTCGPLCPFVKGQKSGRSGGEPLMDNNPEPMTANGNLESGMSYRYQDWCRRIRLDIRCSGYGKTLCWSTEAHRYLLLSRRGIDNIRKACR